MKRFLTLASITILILGLAVVTYADVKWGASGFVRNRSALNVNAQGAPDATAAGFDKTNAWMDTRFRLKFTAKADDVASGVIYFEGDSKRWGEAGAARNTLGGWGADVVGVEVKQAYLDFKVPGLTDFAPTTLRVGIQGLAVRSHFFLSTDGPGVRTETNAGPVRFFLNWFKAGEGTDSASDDADVYGAVISIPELAPVRPGGYFFYYNMNDYPLRAGGRDDGEFWWLGAFADGKVGPVTLSVDFAYMDGKVEYEVTPAAGDAEYSGWAFLADATMSPIENVSVGGMFGYASGDDMGDVAKNEYGGFRIPPGSEQPPIGTYGLVFYSNPVNDGVYIANGGASDAVALGSLGGTWFGKVYGAFKPLDWLKVTGYGMYIGDTTKDGNTIGNAVDPAEASGLEDETGIGIELGAIADIQIYKNLTYSIGAGILFAGDALDTVDATGANKSPDDPWAILSLLIFTF